MRSVGGYRYRLSIEQGASGRDSSGGVTRVWVPVGLMWAELRQYSGFERRATSAGGGVQGVARMEIRTRWRTDIVPTQHRLVHGGTAYGIQSLAGSEASGELIIVCDTGAPHA